MAEKFPNFEYVPELAEYMLKFINKLPSHDADRPDGFMYKVKEDVPDQVHEAFFDLAGTSEERYDILIELSDAANDRDGVERYISEIEPPVYTSELFDWLNADFYDRLALANEALSNGMQSIEGAISDAWIEVRGSELRAAAKALEGYLNSGDDDDEEEEDSE